MEIIYRDGHKEDSVRLAELINIASQGAVEYLFHNLIPDLTPVQIVAYNLESDNYPHSYRSAVVAEYNQTIVGLSLSYPSHFHRITKEMRSFLPKERLEHFSHFYAARVDHSLYLAALCVDEKFRGNGIGSKLISLTKRKAKENGFASLSLIVLADNTNAQRLYQRSGFEIVEKVALESHELIPHEGGCLLMRCTIAK